MSVIKLAVVDRRAEQGMAVVGKGMEGLSESV